MSTKQRGVISMKNRTPKTQRLVRFGGIEDLGSVVSAGIELVISEDREMQVEFASVRNSVGSESEPVARMREISIGTIKRRES